MESLVEKDKKRYRDLKEMPKFQIFMRKGQEAKNLIVKFLLKNLLNF